MRGSGWAPAALALIFWIACCAWPACAYIAEVGLQSRTTESVVAMTNTTVLLVRTLSWAVVVAAASVLLGWWPGRLLGAAIGRRGFGALALLLAVPICLPSYVVFWCWWQAWPPGSGVHEWVARHEIVPLVRQATLAVSLACWSWPVVAWCVAGCSANAPAHTEDLLRMSALPWWRRALIRLRYDSRGLLIGGLLVGLIAFGNTICFDLAAVFTFGNELRAREALGASPQQLLSTAMPAIVVTVIAAALVWVSLNAPSNTRAQQPQRSTGRGASIYTVVLWCCSLVVPVALLVFNFIVMLSRSGAAPVRQFADYYGSGAINTLGIAVGAGALTSLVALGLCMMWLDHRRWVRVIGHVQALSWLCAGMIPATIAAMALEAAYNRPGVAEDVIYNSPIVLMLGYIGRFAFVGVLLGRWLAMREPGELRDMRRLDGAGTLMRFMRATAPRLAPTVVATFAIAAVLAAGEIAMTNVLRPAGFDVLAPSVLNAMHYQQLDTVLLAVLGQLGLGLLAAVGLLVVLRRRSRGNGAAVATMLAAAVLLSGCARDDGSPKPLDVEFSFGAPGQALGQFDYPRGIAVDPDNKFVYVVDKSARVQRFDMDGKPEGQWRMPAKENGKPTGLNVAPDGRVFVADTHYYRVIAYDADGNELMRFGEYGKEPGQFIYPTDIEFGGDGRLYVSEYGGNDRIQVFDAEGNHVLTIGSLGSEPGQFNRPQSMEFDAETGRLYVADACNHRIQIFSAEGELLGSFGTLGREPGELSYPYDLTLLRDGTLLVAEFGNHRVQHFTTDGRSLGMAGRLGADEGELRYPWGVDTDGRNAFVLDSGNNRVQVIDLP